MTTDYSELISQLSDSGVFTGFGISVVVFIIIAVLGFLFFKRNNKKSKDYIKRELQDYYKGFGNTNNNTYTPAGKVTLDSEGNIHYSRGDSQICIGDLYIDKNETVLFPSLICEWFKDRNYTATQEEKVLKDIEHFITENRLSKKVIIMSDEEAEEYFGA